MFSLPTRTVGAALAAVATTATVALAAPADAATGPGAAPNESVSCGQTYPDRDQSSYVSLTRTHVLLRSAPSTSCTAVGQSERGNSLDYHCFVYGSDGYTWTYLRNVTRGTMGWSRDDLLPNYGSSVHC